MFGRATHAILALILLAPGPLPEASGLQVGEAVPSWEPFWVSGPDAGSRACPTCSYGARPMLQIFTRLEPTTGSLLDEIEKVAVRWKSKDLVCFVIVLDATPDEVRVLTKAHPTKATNVGHPDPETMNADLVRKFRINPAIQTTVIAYRAFRVKRNLVNPEKRASEALNAAAEQLVRRGQHGG